MTQQLWAPWRMSYITSERHQGCIFCEKPAENRDAVNFILYRGSRAFVMMNAYPYNNGHLMVVPYSHAPNLHGLSDDDLAQMMLLTRMCTGVLDEALRPEGYNIGVNLGQVAGAGIADHVHIHVVPRWHGDTNFMAAVADVKVLPQSLAESYRSLRPYFDAQVAGAR